MDPGANSPEKQDKENLVGISSKGLGVCGWILFSLSLLLMIITFPISIWMCLKIIKEY
ncbi:unnamed protein product, partial [Gulo gulo]